jgi:hypothetical protein
VCNAAGHCVPRCDEQGRCAAWLVTGPIQSMYAEGSTLYFTTPSETDPLGNPTSLGTLWRVQDSDPRPERVSNAVGLSAHPPSDVSILGRAAGATYVATYTGTKRTVHEVTDAGAVRLLVDAKILGDPIALSNAVFYMDSAGLWRMRYDADAVPELMVERTGLLGAVAGDNLVWYKSENDPYGNDTYVFDPAASPAEAANSSVGLYIEEDLVGVVGDVGLTSMDGCDVSSYDSTGNLLLHLFSIKNVRKNNEYGESNCESRPYGGWLYVWCGGATSESWSDFDWSLVRSPTSVGRLPQEVLPLEFLTQIAGGSINVDFGWTVGSENVYWVKKTLEPTPQYIFRAPLPPQPCDPDLPCQDTGERCGDDGLCRK